MTTERTPEEIAADELAQEETQFAEGFDGPPPTETPPPAEGAKISPAGESPPAVETPPAETYHQLTTAQWDAIQKLSTQIDDVRAEGVKWRDTAFGKVGGLERTLQQLREATPAGVSIEVTDDIVAEIAAEYPELGARALAAFKAFAGKIKGTAPAAAAAANPQEIESTVQKLVESRVIANELEVLDDAHPDWRELTGPKDSNTPYRVWLAKQPAEYQRKLNSTNSATVISRSITKFEADAKAEADAIAAAAKDVAAKRKAQLEAAAVTRGAGGRPAGTTDDDEFNAGYQSG